MSVHGIYVFGQVSRCVTGCVSAVMLLVVFKLNRWFSCDVIGCFKLNRQLSCNVIGYFKSNHWFSCDVIGRF